MKTFFAVILILTASACETGHDSSLSEMETPTETGQSEATLESEEPNWQVLPSELAAELIASHPMLSNLHDVAVRYCLWSYSGPSYNELLKESRPTFAEDQDFVEKILPIPHENGETVLYRSVYNGVMPFSLGSRFNIWGFQGNAVDPNSSAGQATSTHDDEVNFQVIGTGRGRRIVVDPLGESRYVVRALFSSLDRHEGLTSQGCHAQ